ncbi:MAG: peptidase S8/S53 domain-containing protein [Benjaminiella poitrasii]|nr:MAG: peptidase S8/S53 domain-containing protein [Benjaminiella poitrasii]
MRILSLLACTSIALLSTRRTFVQAAKDNSHTEDEELLNSILSNPKYKVNTLGRIIPGRFIIEFVDSYHGSSLDFITDVESDISQTKSIPSSRIKLSIAQDFNSSPSVFRGVSINLEEPETYLTKRDEREEVQMRSIQNAVLRKLVEQHRVKHIYPVTEIPRPKVKIISSNIRAYENGSIVPDLSEIDLPEGGPSLPFTHVMTQVDKVHSKYKGKGIVVGIIDSGVDYQHPALGGGFGPGYPIRYGYDLVGNNFNTRNISSREQNETPLDACEDGTGHGTHVAGIIAANDKLYNFTGVAPEVTIGAWRVFGCDGATSNDLIIKALISAYETGCDIINLSLGSSSNWAEDPTSIVANRISERGIIVIGAAGNDGVEGAFYISSPSTGLNTVAAASVDNDLALHQTFYSENGGQYQFLLSSTTNEFPSGHLVSYSSETSGSDGCEGSNPDNELEGKIVLVQRGNCTFDQKALEVEKHGAIGIIIYNNLPDDALLKIQALKTTLPLASISMESGEELKESLTNNTSFAENGIYIEFNSTLSPKEVPTARKISEFSSIGPLYSTDLKPDLAAPGGYIFSTLPIANGGYGILSGTSMAAPYIAGACALYLEAHGKNQNSIFLKEHLQNYARPLTVLKDRLDNPARQGSGLIQVMDAITQTVHVSPGALSFNDTDHIGPRKLNITNPSNSTVTYIVENKQSLAISPYNTTQQGFAPLTSVQYAPDRVVAEIAFSHDQVTLGPGESIEIELNVTSIGSISSESPYPIYGGYVKLSPTAPSETNSDIKPVHVPYIGIRGSLNRLPIFDAAFPRMFVANTNRTSNDLKMANFAIERATSSSFVTSIIRLLTGTSQLITEVLHENMTKIGYYSEYTYLPRNTLRGIDFIFMQRWNGTVVPVGNGTLSDLITLDPGYYLLRWKALKLLSDPSDSNSWETKLSPPILIRP